MSENGNGLYTKVALLMDREHDNHEDVMHKLRNIEQSNNYMYEEIKDIQKRIKYMVLGAMCVYGLTQGGFVPFVSLFKPEEGRLGVVVTFLALMELMKESLIELVQTEGYGSIHIKAKSE